MFILSLLAIVGIVMFCRYHRSSNLASNLMLTFAFSVFVGLGIKYYLKDNVSKDKKTVLTENVSTVNANPMQMVAPALETGNTQSSVGQDEHYTVNPLVSLPNKLIYNSFWKIINPPILFDTS